MKLNNTLDAYTDSDISNFGERIADYFVILKEVADILDVELVKPTLPKEGENVIYVDFLPFTEFDRLKDKGIPLHELIDVYESWSHSLWEKTIINVGNYNIPKVVEYIVRLRSQVCTFQNFFEKTSNPPK